MAGRDIHPAECYGVNFSTRELAHIRYSWVLYALLVWKFLTPEHIAGHLHIALPNAYRYIRRLRDLGLVRSDRVLGHTLVSLTAEGREFTFDLLPEVDRFRYLYPSYGWKGEAPHNFTHELKVREICLSKHEPCVSYSVYAKVLARVYGEKTIGLHRADAVELYEQDGHIYPIAIEVELSPKKNSKVKGKLRKIAEAIGEYYSGVRFFFKRDAYRDKFKQLSMRLPSAHAQKLVKYSDLHGHSYLKGIEIYRDIEQELRHLSRRSHEIDKAIAKELNRKLR